MSLELKDILNMLKSGELSIDEAEKLISKLKEKEATKSSKEWSALFEDFETKVRMEFNNLVSDEKNVDANWQNIFKKVEVKVKDTLNEIFNK
ncbi:MAG: hypothetical protein KJ666_02665 [Bacteroidetes bacterium]|nr:hypothetical protein [Bacteroidota bacterium]